MIQSVGPGNAMYNAVQGMQKAMKQADTAAKAVARGEVEAKRMVELELAQQNVKMQTKNIQAAMEMGQQILDILA